MISRVYVEKEGKCMMCDEKEETLLHILDGWHDTITLFCTKPV